MKYQQIGFRFPYLASGVRALLVVLVAFYVFFAVATRFEWGQWLFGLLILDPELVWSQGYVWQLLTYALLHDVQNPFHLILNGLLFYFVAPDLEQRWGLKRFFIFVTLTALGGALFVCLAWLLGLSHQPVLGFSAVCLGLLVAWGLTFSNRELYFFGIFPLNGKSLVWLTLGFEVLYAVSAGNVSSAAHFGGMATGALLTLGLWRPTRLKRYLH